MGFKLSSRFTKNEGELVITKIEEFHRTNDVLRQEGKKEKSVNELQNELKAEGLGYRRANLQHDIRRVESSYLATDTDAEARALDWFDNVYEKFREGKKLTSKEVSEIWEMARSESWETYEQEELGQEILDLYG